MSIKRGMSLLLKTSSSSNLRLREVVGGMWSIIMGHITREGDNLASTFSRDASSSPRRNSSLVIIRESQERGGLPQTLEDDIPGILGAEDIKFVSRIQPREYITQIPNQTKRISQETLGSSQDHFEITTFFTYT